MSVWANGVCALWETGGLHIPASHPVIAGVDLGPLTTNVTQKWRFTHRLLPLSSVSVYGGYRSCTDTCTQHMLSLYKISSFAQDQRKFKKNNFKHINYQQYTSCNALSYRRLSAHPSVFGWDKVAETADSVGRVAQHNSILLAQKWYDKVNVLISVYLTLKSSSS